MAVPGAVDERPAADPAGAAGQGGVGRHRLQALWVTGEVGGVEVVPDGDPAEAQCLDAVPQVEQLLDRRALQPRVHTEDRHERTVTPRRYRRHGPHGVAWLTGGAGHTGRGSWAWPGRRWSTADGPMSRWADEPMGRRADEMEERGMGGPLSGVRVVEIVGIGPGPFAAMMLSDMGAEVLRVDRASAVRPGATPAEPPKDVLARGRRSIGVDLKHPDGVQTVLRLVESADALIEGYRPGVAERLGIRSEECLARNPRLVYGRLTGWDQDGP